MTKTFVSFQVPKEVAIQISKLPILIESKLPKEAKFIHENLDNVHIIIFNVGVIDQEKVSELLEATQLASESYLPFELGISHLDYLYKTKKGSESVIFLNIKDTEKSIKSFYKNFFKILGDAGFYPPERATPQIILTKVRQLRRPEDQKRMLSEIAEIEIPKFPSFQVNSVYIFQSIEHYGAATQYKLIKSFPLQMKPLSKTS